MLLFRLVELWLTHDSSPANFTVLQVGLPAACSMEIAVRDIAELVWLESRGGQSSGVAGCTGARGVQARRLLTSGREWQRVRHGGGERKRFSSPAWGSIHHRGSIGGMDEGMGFEAWTQLG